MGSYLSNTTKQQDEMLKEAGYSSFEDLFSHIPQEVMLNRELQIPKGCSEMEVLEKLEQMASSNVVFPHIFRGAGLNTIKKP